MERSGGASDSEYIQAYVKGSVRRMIVGTTVCLSIMALAFFVSFPSCARSDKVIAVQQAGNKYYLTLEGESGTFGIWSETKQDIGERVCVRPTFAQ